MVDLRRQYAKIKPEIDRAIDRVIDTAAFINGPDVREFADELASYLGVKHVIPCANGTDALQISLMALGLKPGDEVITPSFTYIATVEVVALLGLKPVFVDVDERTFTMDVASLRNAINPKTKAIIPVHLYGHSAPMQEILDIANEKQIPVIEDNAQALGGDYIYSDGTKVKNGSMGLIGCTSFFPSKNLGCYGDGGAMFTNDDALAVKLKMISNHGQSKKYIHDLVGCNSRLDTIQAAILRVKLKHLNSYCEARKRAADYYDFAFANSENIQTPYRAKHTNHVFHQYTIQLVGVDRSLLTAHLATKNIPSMLYYPVPSHKQKMFEKLNDRNFELPVTERLQDQVLSLPMHTELTIEELKYITDCVLEGIMNQKTN